MRKHFAILLALVLVFSLSLSAFASGAYAESSERDNQTLPFSFSLLNIQDTTATVEVTSDIRIDSFKLGISNEKDVISLDSTTFSLSLNHTYSFEIQYNAEGTTTVYNGKLSFASEDDSTRLLTENIVCNLISDYQVQSAGTTYESESNNTYSTADRTYDDYDNYGAISTSSDVDWWVVSFTRGGRANFWLGNIPSGCDYDLRLYASDGTTLLASSTTGSNQAELITYPVVASVNYYVKITSYSGSSTSQYLFRAKNYPEVIVDRLYSTYSQTATYREALEGNMNCYGYAIHVYSLSGDDYRQQPGEFARDNKTFQSLAIEQDNAIYGSSATGTSILDYIESNMYADFNTLNTYSGSEWSIKPTTRTSTVPSGFRKIALTVGVHLDYHFYLRHSDGKWSHKPGSGPVTNLSFDSKVVITDSNIATAVTEGGYDDGVRYYLIGKSAIADYPHNNGHALSALYTTTSFLDCAGDTISKAATITGSSKTARFDYANDVDYFEFKPTVTGTYTFTTSLTSSTYDVDMVIYDNQGNVLTSDYSTGNPSISIALTANSLYYIRVIDAKHNVTQYTLYYRR